MNEVMNEVMNGDPTYIDRGFDIFEYIKSEAGVVAVVLMVVCGALAYAYWCERKNNKQLSKNLYTLGMTTVEQITPMSNTLEKIYQLLAFRVVPPTQEEKDEDNE